MNTPYACNLPFRRFFSADYCPKKREPNLRKPPSARDGPSPKLTVRLPARFGVPVRLGYADPDEPSLELLVIMPIEEKMPPTGEKDDRFGEVGIVREAATFGSISIFERKEVSARSDIVDVFSKNASSRAFWSVRRTPCGRS